MIWIGGAYTSIPAHEGWSMFKSLTARITARTMAALAAMSLTSGPPTVTPPAHAAHDTETGLAPVPADKRLDTSLQIVVLETEDCIYCSLFRRNVVPVYETSPKGRDVPIKFVDMNDKAYDQLGLDSPVDMVPTAVLMQNNREVGRIPGYVGPENFFHAINHLLSRVP